VIRKSEFWPATFRRGTEKWASTRWKNDFSDFFCKSHSAATLVRGLTWKNKGHSTQTQRWRLGEMDLNNWAKQKRFLKVQSWFLRFE
jgi:hypothetical protein